MRQELREQVLRRDNNKCTECGKKRTRLDIHHVIAIAKGGSDNMINLITLCPKCHRAAEFDIRFGLLECDGCKMRVPGLVGRRGINMSLCSKCDKLFFKRDRLVLI